MSVETATKERESRVSKYTRSYDSVTPKYHGAREILWESAQTIG